MEMINGRLCVAKDQFDTGKLLHVSLTLLFSQTGFEWIQLLDNLPLKFSIYSPPKVL